jgi:hypothetical protein
MLAVSVIGVIKHLSNVGKLLTDYMAKHPRKVIFQLAVVRI